MKRPAVDRMFKGFSDPLRLRILHLLRGGELCVCDLVEILKVPQATASHHLAYLKRSGLVTNRRERYWTYYAVVPGRTAFHKKLLECLDTCFVAVPALAVDGKRARTIRARGACAPTHGHDGGWQMAPV
jgi:ArsR family transcriptional regulator